MELLPPHSQVVSFAGSVSELALHLRSNRKEILQKIGTWEADVEALNLIMLCCSHAIALDTLAKTSLSLQPSACVIARAAMESGTRALWLLQSDNAFDREARWLAHLESEVGTRKRISEILESDQAAEIIEKFIFNVRAKLPAETLDPVKVPNFNAMLNSLGYPEKYGLYINLSQSAHATSYGGNVYRKNVGTEKVFGEFINSDDWWMPIATTWWFLVMPVLRFMEHLPKLGLDLVPIDIQNRFVLAQNTFKSSKNSDAGSTLVTNK